MVLSIEFVVKMGLEICEVIPLELWDVSATVVVSTKKRVTENL